MRVLEGVDGVMDSVEEHGGADGVGEEMTVELGAEVPGEAGKGELDAGLGEVLLEFKDHTGG